MSIPLLTLNHLTLKTLFPPYLPHIPPPNYLPLLLLFREDGAVDAAADEFFRFGGEPRQVFEVDLFSDEGQVEVVGVAANGKVANEVGCSDISEAADELVNEAVDPHGLAEDAGDFAEERMVAVGAEHLAVLLFARQQQASLLEAVQLEADGIGALPELFGQAAQVAMHLRSKEKFGKDLQPGLPRNKQI